MKLKTNWRLAKWNSLNIVLAMQNFHDFIRGLVGSQIFFYIFLLKLQLKWRWFWTKSQEIT